MWRGGKGEEVKGRREEGEWRRGSGGGGEEMELSAACPNA